MGNPPIISNHPVTQHTKSCHKGSSRLKEKQVYLRVLYLLNIPVDNGKKTLRIIWSCFKIMVRGTTMLIAGIKTSHFFNFTFIP
jgi:hypothetical protein